MYKSKPMFWIPKMPAEATNKAVEYYKNNEINREKYPFMLDWLVAYEKKYFEIEALKEKEN